MRRSGHLRLPEFRPGNVFWLPRGSSWLNRDKPRPFVLATRCGPDVMGTLVYGSTRDTEAQVGAVRLEISPMGTGLNRNGLVARTSFYPGILFREAYAALPGPGGSLGASLRDLRTALREALGIGRGSCLRADAPPGSRRGRVVELGAATAAHLRTRLAVLLTAPEYSRARNYHAILPILRGDRFTGAAGVLRVDRQGGFAFFPDPVRSILLPIPAVQSVWYPERIARETEHVLDEASLARIDRALCDYFSLPDPPAGG